MKGMGRNTSGPELHPEGHQQPGVGYRNDGGRAVLFVPPCGRASAAVTMAE